MGALLLLDPSSPLVGVVGALGMFARFTFPLFVAPVLRWPPSVRIVTAAVITSGVMVALDSAYYGRWVLTPLNAFLYNLRPSNLAQVGGG